MSRALIVGIGGVALTDSEIDFLHDADPWGVILFSRNIDAPDQVRLLTSAIRAALGRPDAPILVDQEGGRVQRLGPPHWPLYPSAARIGRLYLADRNAGLEAAWLSGRLIASDIHALGITVSCLPVLDLGLPQTHSVIGDRAYGADPQSVAALGRAAARGLAAGGCLAVMKHIPGHGRANCDSHLALPIVEEPREVLREADFVPFRALSDLAMGMTAHVRYEAFDRERPATLSPSIINQVIRGDIGFDGLLMSDDLSMGALAGGLAERAEGCIAAGCDVALHCNGRLDEMAAVAGTVPELAGRALERAAAALGSLVRPEPVDVAASISRLDDLLNGMA